MSVIKNKRIFLSPPYVGKDERDMVMAAFDSGYIAPCGPQVDEFELKLASLANRKFAVALSSGTAAIDLLLEELKVGKGWTLIAPTLSFIATVGPAWHRGAKLVFVDSNETGNIDTSLLEVALKAARGKVLVIGVDLYGRCCDYDTIEKLCRQYRATCLIDAAESVGAKYKGRGSGSSGLAAIYSFNGNKVVTTSGGGAIVTDSKGVAERARKRSQQSREAKLYYEHKSVGYNYRMSNILASIGLAQLGRLKEILSLRQRNAAAYREFSMLPKVDGENNWLNVMLCKSERERDRVIATLAEANIESRPVWKPLHLQPVFKGCKCYGGKVAEKLFKRGVCLPSGPGLTPADLSRIVSIIKLVID